MTKIDKTLETELEAAAFRRLVEHLRERTDVQNIDLMNLAGFCRNCLANWYQEAAGAKGLELTKDGAREIIYGMPYKDWQAKHQKEAERRAEGRLRQGQAAWALGSEPAPRHPDQVAPGFSLSFRARNQGSSASTATTSSMDAVGALRLRRDQDLVEP